MKIASILIISLVSGFLYAIKSPRSRYKILRSDNYIQYLWIAYYSIIGFIISVVLYGIIVGSNINGFIIENCFIFKIINDFINTFFDDPQSIIYLHVFNILTINFIIAHVGILKDKCMSDDKKNEILKNLKRDHYFERLINDCRDYKLPISITMSNNKVYIGHVRDDIDPSSNRKEVRIFPLASGYRDPKDHTIKLTTYYTKVYKTIKENNISFSKKNDIEKELNKFFIIIPYDQIISSNIFDQNYYKQFNSDN